ncbi:MAG: ATP-dependent DNA ligase, partial [Candidatus Paceibacteria bacterium]
LKQGLLPFAIIYLVMKFSQLATYFEKLEQTTSRNEITAILSELLKHADVDEIDKVCYLSLGQLLPAYRGIEFNIAERMLVSILAYAFGQAPEKVNSLYKEKGDLGDVAYELSKKNPRKPSKDLSVKEVYDFMFEVAEESGEGSQERKIQKMAKLLSLLDPLSCKYVTRIPAGNLRLGFSDATILDALSVMERGDKSARPIIERAYNVTADIGAISKLIKKSGIKGLKSVKAQPGIPIRPSLAERISSSEEIIEKLGPMVAVEPKLDGFRTAIHVWKEGGKKQVALFSRNLENTTHMFPEIVNAAKAIKAESVILDGEAIGYNPKTGRFTPFQETIQRKRKYGIEEMAKKLPLSVFVFDILYLNGKSLLESPFSWRRKVLENLLSSLKGTIKLAEQKLTDSPEIINKELSAAISRGLEGLVVKNLHSHYEAGSRGFHWVKLKATSAALKMKRKGKKIGLLDTIDCVVMGAYKGKGKRAGFGIGGFLLGVKDKDEKFYTISKLGSGLSDEDFLKAARRIERLKVAAQPKEYVVTKEEIPDIWVRPALVVEVLSDEITLSPRHTAGRVRERGYSLRFPRLVKFRDDKNPEDVTTVKEIEKMYKAQKH